MDIIVHLGRLRDKSRKVLEIAELTGCENNEIRMNQLFLFEETGEVQGGKVMGRLVKKGELYHGHKLKTAGLS